jgi:O-antigen/teichoic acid export membrane protein
MLVLLTRALAADDLGTLLASLAAGLLGATLAVGGLSDATARNASASADAGFGTGDLARALRRFALVLPLVLLAVLGVTADAAGGLAWGPLCAGVLLALTQGGTTILASVFRARGQAGRFALYTGLVTSAGRTLVAAVALAADLGAPFVLWSFVLVNAAVTVATWREATRGLSAGAAGAEGDASLHLGGAVWSLLANLDVIVVGLVLGADTAGRYGASMRIAEVSSQVLVAISVLYLPEATRLVVAGRRESLLRLYRTAGKWSAATTLLLAGVGFVAAGDIARLLFPEEASTTATLLRILFVGYAVHGAFGSNYGTLVALGDYRAIRRLSLVFLPLLPLATLVLTQVGGANGAAAATAGGYVVLNVVLTVELTRLIRATPFDRWYGRAVLACAASWGVAAVVTGLAGDAAPLAVLAAAGAAAGLTWAVLLRSFGALTPVEREAMGRLVRRRAAPRPA